MDGCMDCSLNKLLRREQSKLLPTPGIKALRGLDFLGVEGVERVGWGGGCDCVTGRGICEQGDAADVDRSLGKSHSHTLNSSV